MRNNSNDRTLERNHIQKYRFLIREYEQVKAKRHYQFRFLQDFYTYHGTNRQTFAKYYNRYRQSGSNDALLPRKRGPRWKSRRTIPFIEEKVLELRRKGINRYEIYAILKPVLKSHTPAPSTIYAITKRHGLNRLTKPMRQSKRRRTGPSRQPLPEQGPDHGGQAALFPGVRARLRHTPDAEFEPE